jgi:chorismate mutase/prephenate dehydratase
VSDNKNPGSGEQQVRQLREQIDELDKQIQELISQRARHAQAIATAKLATKHVGKNNSFYRPEREAEILRRVLKRNAGPLSNEEMARLFREIMSACLALESPLKIAFLGPEGTYSEAAALKHFGHAISASKLVTIDEVFREVESGNVHFGVVPIENSTEGTINRTLDMLAQSPLRICGEVQLRIHHYLLGKGKGTRNIKKVLSHQQSLAQCREWLNANLPGVKSVAVNSNAEAARLVADKYTAAIAGETAADIYRLNVLAKNIEDEPNNTTRFLVIGELDTAPSGDDKTSLLLSAANRPGALHKLLAPLARRSISMTRIESRPARQGLWEYVFFLDIEGHAQQENIREALSELAQEAAFLKLLGSYPRAVL